MDAKSNVGQNSEVNRRILRVEREMRTVIANFVSQDLREQIAGLVTITEVKVSKDLRYAKVFVSQLAVEDTRANIVTLADSAWDIQRKMNAAMRLKYCPKLTFFNDDRFEQLEHVDSVLASLKSNSGAL